jgi:hypothetical protein
MGILIYYGIWLKNVTRVSRNGIMMAKERYTRPLSEAILNV